MPSKAKEKSFFLWVGLMGRDYSEVYTQYLEVTEEQFNKSKARLENMGYETRIVDGSTGNVFLDVIGKEEA
ncbi:MAG: hypothetical protein AAF546_00080 [Verrucomicrobiota bacterium]